MIFSVVLLLQAAFYHAVEADRKPVVCYYTNWSQYRPGDAKFIPSDIDVSLCDDLIFAFAALSESRPCTLIPVEWNDDGPNGMYEQFTSLKILKPSLRTLLSVGGWSMGTETMTLMLSTAETRAEFVTSSIEYLRSRNFDGLDLHFEYPGNHGSPPEDKQRFTSLVQELRAAYDEESRRTKQTPLLITAAVSAVRTIITSAYEIDKICSELDSIGLMSYDFEGGWGSSTGHNAQLHARSTQESYNAELNVEWAADYWVSQGCPKSKLLIGMPMYGRGFTLRDPDQNGFGAPADGPSPSMEYTREAGFLSYYEICTLSNVNRVFDEESKVPYVYDESVWIGYDDDESLRNKVEWVHEEGLMGVMVWAMDLDDFSGSFCDQGPYPLLTTLNMEYNASLSTVEQPEFTTSSDVTSD